MNMNTVMQCTGTSCIYCTFRKLDEDNNMMYDYAYCIIHYISLSQYMYL